MGEIADALKKSRARLARTREADSQSEAPAPNVGSHAEALRRSRAESPAPLSSPSPATPAQPADFSDRYVRIEAHRHLAMRIQSALEAASSRSLAMVSALRNEGKTTVVCNVGAAMASLSREREVAVLDLDLRNPNIHRWMGLSPSLGIESFLQGEVELDQICLRLENPDIDIYPAAVPQRSAHELLVTPHFEALIRHLEASYRTVLIDTPPCLMVPDANLIMNNVSSCAVVVRAGESRVRRFKDVLDALPANKQLGTILNGTTQIFHRRGYEYYGAEEADDAADPSEEAS